MSNKNNGAFSELAALHLKLLNLCEEVKNRSRSADGKYLGLPSWNADELAKRKVLRNQIDFHRQAHDFSDGDEQRAVERAEELAAETQSRANIEQESSHGNETS
jgi:hypothetical protein